jgi:phosphate transport system substrate-binding protein
MSSVTRFWKPAATLLVTLYVVWVVAASTTGERTPVIVIDGSSTVFPITEAAAEDFQLGQQGRVQVLVGISGSGGGFKKFCRGETDIQDASRPITPVERDICRRHGVAYYELPIAYDAMTIVVSPENTWVDSMTLEELKRIWEPSAQRTVTRWNQIRPEWPDAPFKLFGAGSDSGTFDYFTEVVVGRAKASRGDYTASEDDNTLVQGIMRDRYALGYIPYSYYENNRHLLKAVPIDAGSGPRAPSRETVENGTYGPFARPLLLYVNERSAARPEVREFVETYLKMAGALAAEVGFVPLPAEIYRLVTERFRAGRVGTAFAAKPAAGTPLIEIVRLETVL